MERSLNATSRQPILAIVVASSFALVIALGGCDSGTQEPDAPQAEGVEIQLPAPSGQTEARNGGEIDPSRFPAELPDGAVAAVPENFPETIPVYPGAAPAMGRGANVEGSERSGMQLLSNDSPDDVFAYYQNELAAEGWVLDDPEVAVPNSITASKGTATMGLFVSPAEGGGSDIFVIHQSQ